MRNRINFEIIPDPKYSVEPVNLVGVSNELINDIIFTNANSIFFANTGDDDTGDGTQETPFKTIQKAIDTCDAVFMYAVSLDSWYHDLTEPLINNTFCKGLYAVDGEILTIQCNNTEIPNGFISALSDIDRKIFCEWDEYLFCAAGATDIENVYYFDGTTWVLSQTITGENITSIKATFLGLYITTDSGKIIRYTDFETYATVHNNANYNILDIAEYNGYIYAVAIDIIDSSNVVLRSSNGIDFLEVTTNLNDVEFTDELVSSVNVYDDKLIITTNHNLLTSEDGAAYTVLYAFTYAGTLLKSYTWENYLYVIISDFGIAKIDSSNIATFSFVIALYESVIGINSNTHLYVTDINGDLYRSKNGSDFEIIKSAIGQNIGVFKKQLYIDDNYINSAFIINDVDNFQLQNVYCVTNCIDFLIYNSSELGNKINNCYLTGFEIGINYNTDDMEFKNNDVRDCFNVIEINATGVVEENLFFDIDDICILINANASTLTVNHNTFFQVNEAIKILGSITASIKNTIFYNCFTFAINSAVFVYLEYCCLSRVRVLNAGNIDCIIANPLFVNEENDFRLKTSEPYDVNGTGFALESPCKNAADDNYDIGCYLFNRNIIEQADPIIITPIATPTKVEEEIYKPFFQANTSISGASILNSLSERRRIIMQFDKNRYVPDLENILYMLSNQSFYFYETKKTFSGYGILNTVQITNNYAKWKLQEIGKQFKVLRTTNLFKLGEVVGYLLEINDYRERILFNTENEIYVHYESEIPEGAYNFKVEKIRMILNQNSLKSERLLQRFDRNNNFTITLDEADV